MATEGIPVLGSKGGRLDLLITQGKTLSRRFIRFNPDGSRMNLTGKKFVAEIRKTADSPTLSGSAVFVLTDPVNGEYRMTFTDETTAAIPCHPSGETHPDSRYEWDKEMHNEDGTVEPVMYGEVGVFREVSKGAPV